VAISATFTQSLASTPVITLKSTSPVTAGSQLVKLDRITYLTSTNPTNISYFNILTPDVTYPIPTWTYNGTVIQFTNTFPAGGYSFKLFYSNIGWANSTSILNITPSAAYTLDQANTVSSHAGGQIVVKGSSISPDAVVQIGGFSGKMISQTADSAIFAIPPLITTDVAALYPALTDVQLIKPAAIISDGGNYSASAFDGLHATYYSSGSA